MTTKTDFHSIRDLSERYHPAQRGIVSEAEIKLIQGVLEIDTRTTIELQNVRDMTVMLYGNWTDAAMENDSKKAMELMDAMSAITCVIDQDLFNRR